MSLIGKWECDVEIKADPARFHDAFVSRPQETTQTSRCDLYEGDWGTLGSIVNWSFVHDGKAQVAKVKLDAIDGVNKSMTYSLFEGDVMEEFKSFVLTVYAKAKGDGNGSVVHWTLAYEKLNVDVAAPDSFLQFLMQLTKDIDANLHQ